MSSTGSDPDGRTRDELLDHVYGRARRLWWQRRVAPVLSAAVVLTALVATPVLLHDGGDGRRLEILAGEGDIESAPPAATSAPRATLRSSAGEVEGTVGLYCWSGTARLLPGEDNCRDLVGVPQPPETLVVQRGEQVTLAFAAHLQLTALGAEDFLVVTPTPFTVPATNPSRFVLDLPLGGHMLHFTPRWSDGSASIFFRVEIAEAAPSTTTGTPARPLPPVDLQPDPSKPPRAALRSSAGEVEGTPGSYCWTTTNSDGTGQGLCGDTDALDPDVTLPVRRGERVTLRFATDQVPKEVEASVADGDDPEKWRAFAIPSQNPSEFVLDLPLGIHRLSFQAQWEQGGGTHYFKVEIR